MKLLARRLSRALASGGQLTSTLSRERRSRWRGSSCICLTVAKSIFILRHAAARADQSRNHVINSREQLGNSHGKKKRHRPCRIVCRLISCRWIDVLANPLRASFSTGCRMGRTPYLCGCFCCVALYPISHPLLALHADRRIIRSGCSVGSSHV